jgi:ribonucleoside-diphosphate reductase alpha chain
MTVMSLYQQVIFKTRYARWVEEEGRRENWDETVKRYCDYFEDHLKEKHSHKIPRKVLKEVYDSIYNLEVMPSMRTLMTSGKALESAEVANYNCAFLVVDAVRAFSEHMYVLMCGAGSGFSVERRFTEKLPEVPEELHPSDTTIIVADSRKGWCAAYNQYLNLLFAGNIAKVNVDKVRKEGTRLKTFGGYASGPGPLLDLFKHTEEIFRGAQGRQLRPIEVFSIMCYIAQIVVVGGVRRSATIALFDKDDIEMRTAKSGYWFNDPKRKHYAMANISAVFETKPAAAEFMDIWRDLVASKAGEPGILNRKALWEGAEAIGRATRYEDGSRIPYGVNPCSEIVLQPYSFCNLTGAAIRPEDTLEDIKKKVRVATIIGTWQATVTDFDYLRKVWQSNVEDERLLGVCLAGIMDHPVLSQTTEESARWENELRELAWEVNKSIAEDIGINTTASVTAIKPAGNSGELYDVASGIHPRYAPYYIRSIRQSNGDPMTEFLKATGIPHEVSVQNARDSIFYFPVKSPEGAICAKDRTAIQQLEHWLHMKRNYATHTISATVYVREHEWIAVGAWVYDNFNEVTGLSFLPYDDHIYQQAPYTPCSAEDYEKARGKMPEEIDWSLLKHFEQSDSTTVSQEFACTGGSCALT